MKIGIESISYVRHLGVEKGSYLAREHGYECFDYSNFSNTETPFFKLPEAEFEKQLVLEKEIMAKNGICVNQAHAPWRHPARDFTEEDRAERFECMAKGIRGTAYIGGTDFVIHAIMPFGTNTGERPEEMKEINFDFMNRLCDIADEYGVIIDLENLPFLNLPINNCAQVLDFVKRVNRPCFKVCIDTGHAMVSSQTPADAVKMIGKDYLRTLHVHDNDGYSDLHQIPGLGIANWDDFGKALNGIGYDGVFSLETAVKPDGLSEAEWDIKARELAALAKKISETK